jgi:2-polyprenyl-3-methyl-5-hydroxy-6-metoxy-1,4-benzoquinol methylase
MFAEEFPAQETNITLNQNPNATDAMPTKPHLFGEYSEIVSKLASLSNGNELLEIGVGGSECALVATEMGFNVFGIDICAGNVNQAKKYGINAELQDFDVFEPDQKWDVIIMGDVIEHVPDPVASLAKAERLLNDDGAIWFSTPNFESAFSVVAGHNDPMRREASHKNYFSATSFLALLSRFGLIPLDYRISSHYNGSMEIIAVKEKN